ncbi:hypothetical protein EDD15DRAFT_802007 [Pisolithus albus]|nr:hypothetical protein EDD15DRAFT_802007 [Pisolithus albus]
MVAIFASERPRCCICTPTMCFHLTAGFAALVLCRQAQRGAPPTSAGGLPIVSASNGQSSHWLVSAAGPIRSYALSLRKTPLTTGILGRFLSFLRKARQDRSSVVEQSSAMYLYSVLLSHASGAASGPVRRCQTTTPKQCSDFHCNSPSPQDAGYECTLSPIFFNPSGI